MAKNNSTIKVVRAKLMSKTLSGGDCIASFQEDQGRIYTIYLEKAESAAVDLGDLVQFTIAKVGITQ